MKPVAVLWCVIIGLILPACQDDGKGDYSGVAALLAQRNRARQMISRERAQEKDRSDRDEKSPALSGLGKEKGKAKISAGILYEKKINIVDSSSSESLARGIAYLNKDGQIVKIRIIKQ